MLLNTAISKLKQAYFLKKAHCCLEKNNEVLEFLWLIKRIGYIGGISIINNYAIVFMNYQSNKLSLKKISVFSKPSHRVYLKKHKLVPKTLLDRTKFVGVIILRTNYSRLCSSAECRLLGVGGEPVVVIG